MKGKCVVKIIAVFVFAAAALAGVFLLFLPLPETFSVAQQETYFCTWESGETTKESYVSAYAALSETERGKIVLLRGGSSGEISVSEEYSRVYAVLEEGTLAELLSLKTGEISGLEKAALYRAFGDTIWYGEESFAWNGKRVWRTGRETADTVVLLSGGLPGGFLEETGAETLVLRAEGEITAEDLDGSSVKEIVAEAPYVFSDGALYGANGKRLIAALPDLETLTVWDEAVFCDEGALAFCKNLQFLSVPFTGSAKNTAGTEYVPYFAYVFGEDDEGRYFLPESLKAAEIRGGYLESHAFYRCGGLEEIYAEGVPAKNVEEDAFADCGSLRILRTAARVNLPFTYTLSFDGTCYTYLRVQ